MYVDRTFANMSIVTEEICKNRVYNNIGIDLGTTFSVAAVAEPKLDYGIKINSLADNKGKYMIASSVTFKPKGEENSIQNTWKIYEKLHKLADKNLEFQKSQAKIEMMLNSETIIIGNQSKTLAKNYPTTTCFDSKRLIGKKITD